jgi:hypothetical protein
MVIQGIVKYKIPVFWNDEFKNLDYVNETFNDTDSIERWTNMGFSNKFTGDMCDMRGQQPVWITRFVDIYTEMGWKDIGTSFYRMSSGTVLPTHGDLYKRYIKLFKLKGHEANIRRALVFLEDWHPGHYFEGNDEPFVKWRAGDVVEWNYDTPHLAANLGIEPRYTLQITGHL